MRRFYLTVYLGFVGILLIFGLLVGLAWFIGEGDGDRGGYRGKRTLAISEFIGESIPAQDASTEHLVAWLSRIRVRFDVDAAVFGPEGGRLASIGGRIEPPELDADRSRLRRGPGQVRSDVRVPDGRWLSLVHKFRRSRRGPPWLLGIGLLAIAVAIGAYPVARRITGRVERLQARVDELAGGDLGARVAIEGRDEIADLARSFNLAAARVESLVEAQRMMLASASHELRSPLTRIRMGIELLAPDGQPGSQPDNKAGLASRLRKDIDDLDDLIEELLLASRLESGTGHRSTANVDLLALIAEEGARVDVSVTGTPVQMDGDPRLLRRLVRNLLENALRHGGGAPVRAYLELSAGAVRLVVEDEGPGVPASERERIFEPFYRPPGMREGQDRGVGLGLALVRRIAQHHDGAAICEALSGGGTRFVVTLPLAS